jgi:hypothetical protein
MGTPFLLVPSSLNQPVTYVPRLHCYLCHQTVPSHRLTARWTATPFALRYALRMVRVIADVRPPHDP